MLLHIRPRLFSPFRNISLIDLQIKPLGIDLVGGEDLVTRRPYPNKHYAVACRKRGHKAIDGILIETESFVSELFYTARWAVEGELCVTHFVDYKILDHDFDAASDQMLLWRACCKELGGWSSRMPSGAERKSPMVVEPMMEVVAENVARHRLSEDAVESGWIMRRREIFVMPTIERERILQTELNERIPPIDMVFRLA
jgi:hypothetical protein